MYFFVLLKLEMFKFFYEISLCLQAIKYLNLLISILSIKTIRNLKNDNLKILINKLHKMIFN